MKLTIILALFCLASAEEGEAPETPTLINVAAPKSTFSSIATSDALDWPDHLKDVRPLAVKSKWNGWMPTEDTAVLIHEWDNHVLIQQHGNYAIMGAAAIEDDDRENPELNGLQELVQDDKITIEEYQEKASVIIEKANGGDIKRHTSRTEL
jgi:hypothetical protein